MKNCTLLLILLFLIAAVVLLNSQTNIGHSLILPPKDWDRSKHMLASLVTTNRPGDYLLQFDLVGIEKVTVHTGWYAAHHPQTNVLLKLDRFTVRDGPFSPLVREDRFVWSIEEGRFGRDYRQSLPSDAELLQMRDISSISNFIGGNPFAPGPTNISARSVGRGFFTLRPYDSIETLNVTFMKRTHESEIESVLVKRAVLHPQPKPK